jgi:hypothetical protein
MNLADRVFFGDEGEQGFIKPPAQKFHLSSIDQTPKPTQEIRPVLFHPFQKGAAVMQGEAKARVLFYHPEEGVIAFLPALAVDLIQVPHGLVVMYGEKQIHDLH